MAKIVTILTEGFADWETGLLNGAARNFYGVDTEFATPGGKPVRSIVTRRRRGIAWCYATSTPNAT